MKIRVARMAVIGAVAATMAGASLGGWFRGQEPHAKDEALAATAPQATRQFHCPMHPTYVSEKPGDCPICGMKLVPVEAPAAAEPAPAGERRIAFYRSPMDPSIRSDVPTKDEMGMDFVPVYADDLESPAPVAGRAAVVLSPERRQVLGLRTEAVRRASLDRTIRTVGRVAADERRIQHVHTKYDGYIEALYVDFTGKFVKRGEPLASVYSPELVATQQEYLLAYRAQRQLAASGIASVSRGGVDLLEAARQRLRLWDIRAADVQALERTGEVKRTLDLYADVSGYVVEKMALHGMRVTPTDTLFDIADLSRLWVLADVYESDLSSIRLGMKAEVAVPYLSGRKWTGAVTYVSPTVEEKTRTVKVRVEVDNGGGDLKPEMFADVFLRADTGEGLLVPENAIVDTGSRQLVFVDTGGGRLEPREVTLGGGKAQGRVRVLSGVAEADQVVVAANFLLDSESSLKAALATIAPAGAGSGHAH